MEIDGIAEVLERGDTRNWAKAAFHPDRSGDLIAVAEAGAWFTYYFWNNVSIPSNVAHHHILCRVSSLKRVSLGLSGA